MVDRVRLESGSLTLLDREFESHSLRHPTLRFAELRMASSFASMWYVYILMDNDGKTYIGSTNNLKRRIAEHQNNPCYSTKRLNGIKLNAYVALSSEIKARELEKYFKTGSGKAILKKRILADEVLPVLRSP